MTVVSPAAFGAVAPPGKKWKYGRNIRIPITSEVIPQDRSSQSIRRCFVMIGICLPKVLQQRMYRGTAILPVGHIIA